MGLLTLRGPNHPITYSLSSLNGQVFIHSLPLVYLFHQNDINCTVILKSIILSSLSHIFIIIYMTVFQFGQYVVVHNYLDNKKYTHRVSRDLVYERRHIVEAKKKFTINIFYPWYLSSSYHRHCKLLYPSKYVWKPYRYLYCFSVTANNTSRTKISWILSRINFNPSSVGTKYRIIEGNGFQHKITNLRQLIMSWRCNIP